MSINQLIQAIRPTDIGVIVLLDTMGVWDKRNLHGIIATAQEWCADEEVCAAAFGFLKNGFGRGYVDCFYSNGTPLLDMAKSAVVAAFHLGSIVFDQYDARGAFHLPSMIFKRRLPTNEHRPKPSSDRLPTLRRIAEILEMQRRVRTVLPE